MTNENLNIFERVAETLKEEREVAYIDNPSSTKYFQISHSTDLKEVGRKYPQTEEINLGLAHSLQFEELAEIPLIFGDIYIFKSSKLTDCVSTAAISVHAFILSKRAINIFEQFNLGNYKIYPATIVYKGKSFEYGIVHFVNDLHSNIDFTKSKFYVANILSGYEFDIEIKDRKDYDYIRNEVKQGNYPGTKKWWYVRLKDGVFIPNTITPDIFTIFCSSTHPYISVPLANAIREHGLTGFKIERVYNLRD